MKKQITISLNEETLKFVNQLQHKNAWKNRSEAIDILLNHAFLEVT